ncbi:MAG: hypothetical protein ACWA5L_00890 [bacterium]
MTIASTLTRKKLVKSTCFLSGIKIPHFLPLTGLLLLSACGQQQPADIRQETVESIQQTDIIENTKTIEIFDILGEFGSPVSGLALLSHPTIAYQGGLFVANGEQGLIFVTIEGATPLPAITGNYTMGVAATWISNTNAKMPMGIIAAYDERQQAIRIFKLKPSSFTIEEFPDAQIGLDKISLVGYCLKKAKNDDKIDLIVISKENIVSYDILPINSDQNSVNIADINIELQKATHCQSSTISDITFLTSRPALVQMSARDENVWQKSQEWILPNSSPAGLALLPSTAHSTPLYMTMPQLDDDIGRLYAYQTGQDQPVAFTMKEFEQEAILGPIAALDASGRNFGGLYRKGVIAIVEAKAPYRLALIPLPSVTREFAFPEQSLPISTPIQYQENLPQLIVPEATGIKSDNLKPFKGFTLEENDSDK